MVKPRLLPKLATLAGLHVFFSTIPRYEFLAKAYLLVIICFITWLMLNSWYTAQAPYVLHPSDEWILHYSGLLSCAIGFATFGAMFLCPSDSVRHWITSMSPY